MVVSSNLSTNGVSPQHPEVFMKAVAVERIEDQNIRVLVFAVEFSESTSELSEPDCEAEETASVDTPA